MAKVVSVVNQKGGVGKTTTAINLGAGLALMGKKVLLVDLDPQGNLTSGLGLSTTDNNNAYYCLVSGESLSSQALKTELEGLDVVPSDPNLAGAEVELVEMEGREFRLKEAVSATNLPYDYVIIDCPPSLGLLTLNALCASNSYLVPMQAEFFAMQGLTNLRNTASSVKKLLNPELEEEGIVITMYDPRSNFSKEVLKEIQGFAPEKVFIQVIPRRIKLAESTSHGRPGILYDAACLGAKSYGELAKEFLARERGEKPSQNSRLVMPPDPVDRLGRKSSPSDTIIKEPTNIASIGAEKSM